MRHRSPCPGPQFTTGAPGRWIAKGSNGQVASYPELRFPELPDAVEGVTGSITATWWPMWATDEPETLTYTLSLYGHTARLKGRASNARDS